MNSSPGFTFPQNLVERVRRIAKRQARLLDDVMVEALERGLPLLETPDAPPGWEQEAETFARMYPIWRLEYAGEYVAVYQGRLVDHDPAFTNLMERINARYPDEFVLIRPIRDEAEIVYKHRSIRWAAN